MTTARQSRKGRQAGYFCGLAAWMALTALAAHGAPAQPVVTDPQTGIAISGFDPVSFFADAASNPGRPEWELNIDGTVWRFRNEGNRTAFAENPDVYAPQFGGHDPVAIARGASVPGHPLFWAIKDQHLYLFYSEEARATFLADSQRIIGAAERKWPAVRSTLP